MKAVWKIAIAVLLVGGIINGIATSLLIMGFFDKGPDKVGPMIAQVLYTNQSAGYILIIGTNPPPETIKEARTKHVSFGMDTNWIPVTTTADKEWLRVTANSVSAPIGHKVTVHTNSATNTNK